MPTFILVNKTYVSFNLKPNMIEHRKIELNHISDLALAGVVI